MVVQRLGNGEPVVDLDFDMIFPPWARALSNVNWTPVAVARVAARLLVTRPGIKILDIGSGVGKFCIVGAVTTNGHFTGVEQREHLNAVATNVKEKYSLHNFQTITNNIKSVDFSQYEHFYFFNSFAENIWPHAGMGDNRPLKPNLYHEYTGFVRDQLSDLKAGTRIVTYHANGEEIPDTYRLLKFNHSQTLKIWEKTD